MHVDARVVPVESADAVGRDDLLSRQLLHGLALVALRFASRSLSSTSTVPWTSTIDGSSIPLPVGSENSIATFGLTRESCAFLGTRAPW